MNQDTNTNKTNSGNKTYNQTSSNSNQGNQGNQANKTVATILQTLTTLESEEYPNWRNIVKLQSELINILIENLGKQRQEFQDIRKKVNNMEKRLKTETLANILKPFLTKTYKNNKNKLN